MLKLDCIQDDLALGVCIDQLEATVGVKGMANVETLLCMEIPGTSSGLLHMDEDATTKWAEQYLVEVKGTLEKFPCTDHWVKQRLVEKIEGELSLWRRRYQRYGGNMESMLARIVRKWSLNVQMVHFAWLQRCISGGMSWNLACHLKVIVSL
jgi:hypothetical protein